MIQTILDRSSEVEQAVPQVASVLVSNYADFADGVGVAALPAIHNYDGGLVLRYPSEELLWLTVTGNRIGAGGNELHANWTGISPSSLHSPLREEVAYGSEMITAFVKPHDAMRFYEDFHLKTYAPFDVVQALVPAEGQVMQVPLEASTGTVIGFMVFSRTTAKPFSDRDKAIASAVSNRLATWIDTIRRSEHEQAVALETHRSLLPRSVPRIDRLGIAFHYLPGSNVRHAGGDWFDIIQLEGQKIALMVGTASGSGTRAAVAMAQIRSVIKAFAERGYSSSEVLAQADRTLATVSMEQYATCAYAVVDTADGRVQIANASHYPPLLVRHGLRTYMLDGSSNMALGMMDLGGTDGFQAEDLRLNPGDILLMYTSGRLVRTRSQNVDVALGAIAAAAEGARTAEEACGNILAHCYVADDEMEVGDTTLVALQYMPTRA